MLQGILHKAFALRVKCRGSLVEDEDGWVLEDGPCNADALPLSSREAASPVTDGGVIAQLHLHDEVMGIGYLGRLDDPLAEFLRHLLPCERCHFSEGYVVEDRIVEEDSLLVDIADETAQRMDAQCADVLTVDADAALRHVVITRDEIYQRALSAAALSHKCNGLSFGDGQVDVVQYLPLLIVGKRHVLEDDALLQRPDFRGIFHFPDGILSLQYLVDALQGSQSLLYGITGTREILERLQRGVEDDEVVDEDAGIDGRVPGED